MTYFSFLFFCRVSVKHFMRYGLQFRKKMDGCLQEIVLAWLGKSRVKLIMNCSSLTLQILLDHFIEQIMMLFFLFLFILFCFLFLNSPILTYLVIWVIIRCLTLKNVCFVFGEMLTSQML